MIMTAITPYIWIIKIAAVGLLCVGIGVGVANHYGTKIDLLEAKHQTQLLTIEAESNAISLQLEKSRGEFEAKLNEKKSELDERYDQKINALQLSVKHLANIRLRDPNSNQARPGGSGPNSGPPSSAEGAGGSELSHRTSQFLLGEAARADVTREKLIMCINWVTEIETQNKQQIKEIEKLQD